MMLCVSAICNTSFLQNNPTKKLYVNAQKIPQTSIPFLYPFSIEIAEKNDVTREGEGFGVFSYFFESENYFLRPFPKYL